jgi:hypothetical protein
MLTQLYVVGDKFKNFSENPKVISISALEILVNSINEKIETSEQYLIYVGQGISTERLKILDAKIAQANIENIIQLKTPEYYEKADSNLTHKHKIENIMISDPMRQDADHYISVLMLDDNCAEMSDHVTGQHIQGMVLVEAARQMTLAVTEKYFLDENSRRKIDFVTNHLETNFHNFVFPLDVKIDYEIKKIRGLAGNQRFDVIAKFIQNKKICVEVGYGFSVYANGFVKEKEQEQVLLNLDLAFSY